jgi:hypothetical protein
MLYVLIFPFPYVRLPSYLLRQPFRESCLSTAIKVYNKIYIHHMWTLFPYMYEVFVYGLTTFHIRNKIFLSILFVVHLAMPSQQLRLHSVKWKDDRRMMNWKGCGRKLPWLKFKVLSWHLPGGTEDNHKKKNLSHDSWSLGSRFESWTSRTWSKSVNHSTMTFGLFLYHLAFLVKVQLQKIAMPWIKTQIITNRTSSKKPVTICISSVPAISWFPLIWQVHSLTQLSVNLEDWKASWVS